MSKICVDCGERNSSENKFCQKCGSKNLTAKQWTSEETLILVYFIVSMYIIFTFLDPYMEGNGKAYNKYIIVAPAIFIWMLVSIATHHIYKKFIKNPILALATQKCSSCKKDNRIDLKYCIYCGTEFKKEKSTNTIIQYEIIKLIAYVAKADGVISKNEAKIISQLLSSISKENIFSTNRVMLKNVFNSAKNDPNQNYKEVSNSIFDKTSKDYHKKLIRWLAMIVYADGTKNAAQAKAVDEIAEIFKFSKEYMHKLYKDLEPSFHKDDKSESNKSNSNNNGYSSNQDNNNHIDKWYKILQCKQTATNQEIKKAYRDLVKQYHPDAIQGKELPEEFIELANQKLKEINLAYETIKKSRGMR